MTLPYGAVVSALRSAANEAGRLRVAHLAEAIRKSKPLKVEAAAQAFTQLVTGTSLDPVATREVLLELKSMTPAARSIACVVAPALAVEAPLIGRALLGIAAACGAAIGAVVPISVAVDATLLEACRSTPWRVERMGQKKGAERAEELARRVARALGLRIENETPERSEERWNELDLERAEERERAADIEKALRASLPKV
jgi:hypothetical protein